MSSPLGRLLSEPEVEDPPVRTWCGGAPGRSRRRRGRLGARLCPVRWGTRLEMAVGSVIVLSGWLVATVTDGTGVVDAIGGPVVLLFLAALGVSVRYGHIVRRQQLEEVRSCEREMLAHELHDTVAHHVSAITLQAGRALAGSHDLSGAVSTLVVIEEEASRTLNEMHLMVGSLRAHGGLEVLPPRSVADLENLAVGEGHRGLRVDVACRGDLDELRPAVAAALCRVAQESITNVERHARHATRVDALLDGDATGVRLRVSDDDARVVSLLRASGHGLVGMAERVALLGGRLEAGLRSEGGWMVHTATPRRGEPS